MAFNTCGCVEAFSVIMLISLNVLSVESERKGRVIVTFSAQIAWVAFTSCSLRGRSTQKRYLTWQRAPMGWLTIIAINGIL